MRILPVAPMSKNEVEGVEIYKDACDKIFVLNMVGVSKNVIDFFFHRSEEVIFVKLMLQLL